MALKFKQDLSANYGVAECLSPLITRVLCDNPSPYTYTGTSTYIVGTSDGLAVVDPGPDDFDHGVAILRAAAGRKIDKILITHSHIDHSPLAKTLSARTGAAIYGYGPHGAGRKGGLEGEEVEAGADWAYQPDILVANGDTISGPDWTITAVHTPGHTANHMCFHLKEENTVFVGDHVMAWATTVISPPDGDVRHYIESLRKISALNPDILVPTHGPWIKNALPFIRGIIAHRAMREGQILKHINLGLETIEALVSVMYKSTDKRLHPAAARSVLGHLIALVDEERVVCSGPVQLSGRYSMAEGP
jgi:glyoxylase-like metal-dependent hydrolase (beta-lactamase superfamily II)